MAQVDKRAVLAGAIGNMLEWYDFAVFGFFASAISRQFFPSDDHIAGLINTFGVFAAGYLMRPIGGLIFGWIGDRLGRRRALRVSIVVMAIPTTLITVLPTHADIGVAAAGLLVILRLAQGLSVGGEFIGSICYLVESAPPGKRGFFGSWVTFTTVGGMLLGSAVAALLHAFLTDDQIYAWGWRLPFLGGLVVGVVGYWMRRRLTESPEFTAIVDANRLASAPLGEAFRQMPWRILQAGGIVMLLGVGIYTLFVWMPTYLTSIVSPPVPHALLVNTCAMVLMLAVIVYAGRCADRFGFKPVLLTSTIVTALVVWPLFAWIDTSILIAVVVAQLVFALTNGFVQGAIPVTLVEMFPTRLRYSAIALGYNITLAIFGGTAPLVATWLIHRTGDLGAPAYYIAAIAVVTAFATAMLRSRPEAPSTS